MNASETIQAAIDKLEGLRDDSSAWDWRRRQMTGEFGQTIGSWEDLHAYYGITTHEPVETKLVAQNMLSEDAELIVTLHRTINAQLRSMKAGLACVKHGRGGEPVGVALDLARAILGVTS